MKDKIYTEWDKIKDYNIFDNFDSFAKVFNAKPEGRCYRKYPMYPWCKDNFFFGTNEELQQWYKTTDEVPFYTKKYIGSQFGKLSIKDFVQKHDAKSDRSLFAVCQCECGNIVEKEFHALQHGDYKSCGCMRKKVSLYDAHKEIVDARWDWNKNEENPNNINFDSATEYWWKGFESSFLMSPKELLAKGGGTSLPEQSIYFYIKKAFPNARNREKIAYKKTSIEVDIYIPDIKIAIEYDGIRWHKDKFEGDQAKADKLAELGIYLINVREEGLPEISHINGITLICQINNFARDKALVDVVNGIYDIISAFVNKDDISKFKATTEDLKSNKVEIESQYIVGYNENSIANSWLMKFWSDKNKIDPYKISIDSPEKYYFKCNAGYDVLVSPKKILFYSRNRQTKTGIEEPACYSTHCYYFHTEFCPCDISYHTDGDAYTCAYYDKHNRLQIRESSPIVIYKVVDDAINNFYTDTKHYQFILKSKLTKLFDYINPSAIAALNETLRDERIHPDTQKAIVQKEKQFIREQLLDNDWIINNFINTTKISEESKYKIIEDILFNLERFSNLAIPRAVVLLSKYPDLSKIYFSNIPYQRILKKDLILNKQKYGIIDVLIYTLMFKYNEVLDTWLNIATQKLSYEEVDLIFESILLNILVNDHMGTADFIENKTNLGKLIRCCKKYLPNSKSLGLLSEIKSVNDNYFDICDYIRLKQHTKK